jgi:hypothetical protein
VDDIVNDGSHQPKTRLPRLISGEAVSALAKAEPGTGSDLQAVKSTAKCANQDCHQLGPASAQRMPRRHAARETFREAGGEPAGAGTARCQNEN